MKKKTMMKKNGRTGAGGGQQGDADGAATAGVPPLRALTTGVGQVERDKGAARLLSLRAPDGGLRARCACVSCVCRVLFMN
jgi:hypothetical protein